VIDNYITYHRKDVATFVENEFCSMFEGLVKPTCEAFVHYAGPHIIKGLISKENADVICHSRGMCQNPQCKIKDTRSQDSFEAAIKQLYGGRDEYNFTKPAPWQWIVHLFTDHFGDKHLPPFDMDNDSFSDVSTFRGYHWRGADCNEFSSKVYPGRKSGNQARDHDCNGIFGSDTKGKSLEEKLCGNSTRLGVVVAGDSAGAHFSIPEKFFNVTMMTKGTFSDLLPRVADELDLPQESAYTGHTNTTYPTHSIYKKLRKWNLCNNNDFQNLGVNGGDSGNTWGNIKALHRDQKNDHPVLFFLELIGNDVCGSSPSSYTPVENFRSNIVRLLNWLDTTLPKGSHVVILGLADGDMLADFLLGHVHPLNVLYDNVYDFLNCLKISPCAGWLNSDHSIRLRTSAWAKKLSNVYKEILASGITFKNYDIAYYDFPTEDIFKRSLIENLEPQKLIEPCDGFHPSGLFNSFLADWMWYRITVDHPEWIGEENPHNEEIRQLFGLPDLV
jgi:acyloxyacyl hydrolase